MDGFSVIFGSLFMALIVTAFVSPIGIGPLTIAAFVVSFIGFIALTFHMGA